MGYRLNEPLSARPVEPMPPEAVARAARRLRRRRLRKNMRARTISVLPTMFTLGNLLCGFMAVFIASRPMDTPMMFVDWSPLTCAALFVFFGLICDGLDGRVARMTRSTSDLGEQLDSMADMVTFGVAPAFIVVQIVGIQTPFLTEHGDTIYNRVGLVIACIYVACAGLRLARYNVEAGQENTGSNHNYFSGLPSPGAAGTVASLALLHQSFWKNDHTSLSADLAAYIILGSALLCGLAMISRLRYVHLMNRYVRARMPFPVVATAVIVMLALLIQPKLAFAGGFVLYAVSAPLLWLCGKRGTVQA